jgi:hypothetical protein
MCLLQCKKARSRVDAEQLDAPEAAPPPVPPLPYDGRSGSPEIDNRTSSGSALHTMVLKKAARYVNQSLAGFVD